MKIKKEFNKWYTKPRKGYLFSSSTRILSDPRVLVWLTWSSLSMAFLVWTAIFVVSLYQGWFWSSIMTAILASYCLFKTIHFFLITKTMQSGGMNLNELMEAKKNVNRKNK